MPPIYLFEDSHVDRLYPLALSRAVFELRCGAFTLLERLQMQLPQPISGLLVRPGLADVLRERTTIPVNPAVSLSEGIILINARLVLNSPWTDPPVNSAGIHQMAIAYMHLGQELAGKIDFGNILNPKVLEAFLPEVTRITAKSPLIDRPWDLLGYQHELLMADFSKFGKQQSGKLYPGVHLLNESQIHIGEGVKIYPGTVIDAENGPVVIGKGTEIRPNCVVTGPVFVGEKCVLRNGTDLRPANSTWDFWGKPLWENGLTSGRGRRLRT
jgi:hypothetical protein